MGGWHRVRLSKHQILLLLNLNFYHPLPPPHHYVRPQTTAPLSIPASQNQTPPSH